MPSSPTGPTPPRGVAIGTTGANGLDCTVYAPVGGVDTPKFTLAPIHMVSCDAVTLFITIALPTPTKTTEVS
jgi:hypothetical protein